MAEGPLCTARSVVLIPERKRVETKAQYAVTCVAQAALSAASGPFRIYTGIRGGGSLFTSPKVKPHGFTNKKVTLVRHFLLYMIRPTDAAGRRVGRGK